MDSIFHTKRTSLYRHYNSLYPTLAHGYYPSYNSMVSAIAALELYKDNQVTREELEDILKDYDVFGFNPGVEILSPDEYCLEYAALDCKYDLDCSMHFANDELDCMREEYVKIVSETLQIDPYITSQNYHNDRMNKFLQLPESERRKWVNMNSFSIKEKKYIYNHDPSKTIRDRIIPEIQQAKEIFNDIDNLLDMLREPTLSLDIARDHVRYDITSYDNMNRIEYERIMLRNSTYTEDLTGGEYLKGVISAVKTIATRDVNNEELEERYSELVNKLESKPFYHDHTQKKDKNMDR